MQLPSSNPELISELFRQILGDSKQNAPEKASDEVAASAAHFLSVIRKNNEQAGVLTESEVTEIGEFMLQIMQKILRQSHGLSPDSVYPLMISIALWTAENHGEIHALEPVVDALATLANQTREQTELAELSIIAGQIIEACSLTIKNDLDNTNPGRPWRVIHINRAIMATRSHNPEIMQKAFQTLIRHLPQDAPNFFSEGMSEMVRLDYPDHVRQVMQRFYNQWNQQKILH